jgi:hypothetical protein
MRFFKIFKTSVFIFGFFLCLNINAWAIPNLQIYIPGATYDIASETWIIESYEYELLVVGANLNIYDVKIAIAVPEGEDGTVNLSWDEGSFELTEDGGYAYTEYWENYSEEDHDSASHIYSTYAFGKAAIDDYPLMGDGAEVAGHGVFPTDFYEYYIGDFGADEEDVYNFNPPDGYIGDSYYIDYPGDLSNLDSGRGEIKTFHIEVSGYTWADIVAYDHVVKTNGKAKYVFSPFSHDGSGSTPIPEPTTMLLLGSGLAGLAGFRRKSKRS